MTCQDWRAISRCSSFHRLWERLGRHCRHIHKWIRAPQLRSGAKGVRLQSWHFLDGRGWVETQADHPRHWVLDGQVPGSQEGSCFWCFFSFSSFLYFLFASVLFDSWRLQDIYKFGMSQPPWLLALHKKYHKLGPALKYVLDRVRRFGCACELLHGII